MKKLKVNEKDYNLDPHFIGAPIRAIVLQNKNKKAARRQPESVMDLS